jgi:hypothetical protein
MYEFRAKARNGYGRETPYTHSFRIFTNAAQPGMAAFSDITESSITANWKANGNPGGCNTEYFCENTTKGTSSGWIVETSWTETGLHCSTAYTYRVKARNALGRETAWTNLGYAETKPCCSADFFPRDGDVDGLELQVMASEFGQARCAEFPGCISDLAEEYGEVNENDLEVLASQFGRNDCQ